MQDSFKSGTDDTLPRRSASRFALAARLFNAHRLNFRLLEEDAAAMSHESWEADDLQIRVDFRAVIYDLQRFAEQRCALVDLQPLVVHIGKNAAEGAVDELLQRLFSSLASASLA